jgi:hypothetical protein
MRGRIGTHMLLRIPPYDLLVRPWGYSIHDRDSEFRGGTYHVALEAVAKLKSQVETKFHMY